MAIMKRTKSANWMPLKSQPVEKVQSERAAKSRFLSRYFDSHARSELLNLPMSLICDSCESLAHHFASWLLLLLLLHLGCASTLLLLAKIGSLSTLRGVHRPQTGQLERLACLLAGWLAGCTFLVRFTQLYSTTDEQNLPRLLLRLMLCAVCCVLCECARLARCPHLGELLMDLAPTAEQLPPPTGASRLANTPTARRLSSLLSNSQPANSPRLTRSCQAPMQAYECAQTGIALRLSRRLRKCLRADARASRWLHP